MSFVTDIKNPEVKLSITKMLNDVDSWRLVNEGGYCEKFVHESGWQFYTGTYLSIFCKGSEERHTPYLLWLWFLITKKERRFVKAWLKLQEVQHG